ncbi:hypothetical protein [Streptomyces sp. SID5606]|nr:hypothetical protein [Streptomyces sp. SID5606]
MSGTEAARPGRSDALLLLDMTGPQPAHPARNAESGGGRPRRD